MNIHDDTACCCMICQQRIFSYSHPGSCLPLLVWSQFLSSACHSIWLPYLLSSPPYTAWHFFCLSIILAPCSLSFSLVDAPSFFQSSLSTSHRPHLSPLVRPCLFASYKCQSKVNAENTQEPNLLLSCMIFRPTKGWTAVTKSIEAFPTFSALLK